MMLRKTCAAAIAASGIALSAGAVQASTVELEFDGFANGRVNVDYSLNGAAPERVRAGGFDINNVTNNTSFIAWCIDLLTTLRDATYHIDQRPVQVSDAEESLLNRLFTSYYDVALDSTVNSAAFQSAIWEIVYEGAGTLDLGAGDFSLTSPNAAVVSTANTWLANLGTAERYNLTFFDNTQTGNQASQDLVTASPIPLPAGVLLMLGGLGAMGVMRARKTKTA